MREKIVVGFCVCLFAYRTYVATGMHSLLPILFASVIGRKNESEIENCSGETPEEQIIVADTDVSSKEEIIVPALVSSEEPVIPEVVSPEEEVVVSAGVSSKEEPVVPAVVSSTEEPVVPALVSSKEEPVVPAVISSKEEPVVPAVISSKEEPVVPAVVSCKEEPVVPALVSSKEEPVVPAVISSKEEPVVPAVISSKEEPVVPAVVSSKEEPVVPAVISSKEEPVVPTVISSKEEPVVPAVVSCKEEPVVPALVSSKEEPVVPAVISSKEEPVVPLAVGVSSEEGIVVSTLNKPDIPEIIINEPSVPAIHEGAFGVSIRKLKKAAAKRARSRSRVGLNEELKLINYRPQESERLLGNNHWRKWGPYLAEREWSTVREDYSLNGTCWEYFPHDDARTRAYRWGEDGLLGLTDDNCQLCFSLGLWNGKDSILKERLFGLTGTEGNHGEDCKECVYYLDSTPTHSYMKALYKYPQTEYPYGWLVDENQKRSLSDPEFELTDTGVFNENRYWDVYVEYAKVTPNDILIRVSAKNRGPDASTLYLIPQLWYRNTWSWDQEANEQPMIKQIDANHLLGQNTNLGTTHFFAESNPGGLSPTFLFTNNDTRTSSDSQSKYFKDAFHRYIINGESNTVNPEQTGTKCCAVYKLEIPSNGEVTLKFKLSTESTFPPNADFGQIFDTAFAKRMKDADEYYNTIIPGSFNTEQKAVARQGYAGVLWNKQYYKFDVEKWLVSDTEPLVGSRRHVYSKEWKSLHYSGVFSVSDKWEYPWVSNWDLSFNIISLAKLDHRFAKEQLEMVLKRENIGLEGEIPGCEFNFSDVSPPMSAWAVWQVYKLSCDNGEKDLNFLKVAFQALTYHFKRWLSKKDSDGLTILSGGFFQMNNIGFFDCSKEVGDGLKVAVSDQCVWTMFYCQNLIKIAIELVQDDRIYEEVVTRLCETYMRMLVIIKKLKLWNNKDQLYYNYLSCDKKKLPIRVRSMASFVPLFGCLIIEKEKVKQLAQFQDMIKVHQKKYPNFVEQVSFLDNAKLCYESFHIMTVPTPKQLEGVLKHMFDENEFLSPYGIRSLSKFHQDNPYTIDLKGQVTTVRYTPGESESHLFGGNNNWCGPVWININFLIIEALEEYYSYYKDDFKVEFPTGSGNYMNLKDISEELCSRISKLLVPDKNGDRPCHGGDQLYRSDKNWKDLVLFHECFDGDTGRGCGASHMTGWTALAVNCMAKLAKNDD